MLFQIVLRGHGITYSHSNVECKWLDFELVPEGSYAGVDRRQRRNHEYRVLHRKGLALDH